MTWARLADGSTPYTVLTIGDTKYINNQRYAIEKPIRHDVSSSPPVAVTVNLILVNNNKFAVYLTWLFPLLFVYCITGPPPNWAPNSAWGALFTLVRVPWLIDSYYQSQVGGERARGGGTYPLIWWLFQNWNLRIRNVEMEDGGQYECQATTHPPQSIFVNLRVVGEWRPFWVPQRDKFCVWVHL